MGPREAIGSPAAFVAGWLRARSLSVLLYIVIGLISNDELRLSDVGGNLLQRRIRRGLGCNTCDVCHFRMCLLEGSMGMWVPGTVAFGFCGEHGPRPTVGHYAPYSSLTACRMGRGGCKHSSHFDHNEHVSSRIQLYIHRRCNSSHCLYVSTLDRDTEICDRSQKCQPCLRFP